MVSLAVLHCVSRMAYILRGLYNMAGVSAQPTPVFLSRESQGWGAWWAAVYGVAQSQTQLKQLSSSSQELMMDREAWHAGVAKSWT